MKVCIVGATGLVGSTMLKVLEERNFPVSFLLPVATERSIGRNIPFNKQAYPVCSLQEALNANPSLVLF